MRYGPPLGLGKKPAHSKMFGRNNDLRWSLRLAEIVRVDYESMICDLTFLQGDTPPAEEVPISSAYWSKRAFLGAMPEPGAICIVGYSAVHMDQATRPFILAFLPNGLKTALRFDPFGAVPREDEDQTLSNEQAYSSLEGVYGPTRRKMRKIYPGTVYGMSEKGSEIILDEDARLLDRDGQELHLRAEDHSAILKSTDLYVTTGAGRTRSGRIVRNALNTATDFLQGQEVFPEDHPLFEALIDAGFIFADGTLVPDLNSFPQVTLPSGRKHTVITQNLEDSNDLDSRAFTEHRTEIVEFAQASESLGDHDGFDADLIGVPEDQQYRPFIEVVAGTLVGNDPFTSKGRVQYGQLLKPVIFSSTSDLQGDPRLEVVENSEESLDTSLVGAGLYRMRRPDGSGELFLAHDKEGHVYASIPASTSKSGNLGGGRSLDLDMKGSAKITVGQDTETGKSIDLSTLGGLFYTLGASKGSKRSLDMRAKGGLSISAGPDSTGSALNLTLEGQCDVAITGNESKSVSGSSEEVIVGQKRVSADAVSLEAGQGNMTLLSASDMVAQVQGEYTETVGEGKSTTILTGGEETDILSGDSNLNFTTPATREIAFGSTGTHRIEAQAALTVERSSSTTANYTFEAPSGAYEVSYTTGSISLSSGASSMEINTGAIDIEAPTTNIVGQVNLGSSTATNAVVGGIPGPSPHLDYITGLPLTGNPLVKTV